ncbi:hypothetical protein T06_9332 [Trichinella sp. T6]|nr:hypothetical protein T06_9332 [Trichinella sp. T6]
MGRARRMTTQIHHTITDIFVFTAGRPTKREVRLERSLTDVISQVARWPPSSHRPSYPHL